MPALAKNLQAGNSALCANQGFTASKTEVAPSPLRLAPPVGVALIGLVLWGSLMDAMLPLIRERRGIDPATSRAPFAITLVDGTGLNISFTVALAIMR